MKAQVLALCLCMAVAHLELIEPVAVRPGPFMASPVVEPVSSIGLRPLFPPVVPAEPVFIEPAVPLVMDPLLVETPLVHPILEPVIDI